MNDFDLVIRGGTVCTAADTIVCDVGIANGVVQALGRNLAGAKTIDAGGLLVLPGGIDSHVHLAQPSGHGIVMADDFESGTASAACGGNTTILPFAVQPRGQSLRAAVQDYHRLAEGNCYVDHSFHMIISDASDRVLGQELPALVRDGYTSFKIFMTYDDLKLNDREILNVLAVARDEGALVMVHAENDDAIKFMAERLENEGRTQPYGHAVSRPSMVEREATHRAISFAELVDVPIVIVHVSGRGAMEQIRWARDRNLKIYGETCPQYLVLTEDDLNRDGMEGAKFVCSPPPRDTDSQDACWQGLEQGVFQLFSSDHCPFRFDGPDGKQRHGSDAKFRWIPNGIPGVETRLPILFSEGVSKGRISINDFVALTSTNHARMYGLYPRKGTIAVGSDADIVLWDPERKETIRQDILNHGCDYTPYEGLEVTGWPVMTVLRGEVVAQEGKIVGAKGYGAYLRRDLSEMARPGRR
ncbi:dihydropyrimidinase [Terrihabitans sp. B22-R8]|uniref:dihydropyrimidinase n=1 Tax=Terrihabitans sp. B22-R8 TaxID=3425128 RepID=UPI00403CF739